MYFCKVWAARAEQRRIYILNHIIMAKDFREVAQSWLDGDFDPETKGKVIELRNSDPAGFVIRNKLKGMLPKEKVIHIYAPQVSGKEKRKKAPSKAGLLGVEGLSVETLRRLLERSGVVCETESGESVGAEMRRTYTKADLYAVGLCGREDSHAYRDAFCTANDLPTGMTAGALLEAINLFGIALPDGE